MSKKICVYTCITGNYDNLHEIKKPEKGIDYLCFTNNQNLKSNTWKIIYINNEHLNNHYLSRKIKILGHPIISKNYDISVWMDASVVWQKPIMKFIEKYYKNSLLSAFKHSQRNSVKEEAIACLQFRKDSKEKIFQTISFLNNENFPDNIGLYEMTVFIKQHNNSQVIDAMNIWFKTLQQYSKRDQLSFAYAIWKTHLKISTIKLNVWNNQWFYTDKHNFLSQISDCHIYYGESDQNFNFNHYYVYQYIRRGNTYTIKTTIPNDTSTIEINLSNALGVVCKNIIFQPTYNYMMTFGSVEYNKKLAFCIGRSTIKYFGNFKKNQKLIFSINMQIMNVPELQELVEKLWAQNNRLNDQNKILQSNIRSTQHQLQYILNSKSWKLIHSIRTLLKK